MSSTFLPLLDGTDFGEVGTKSVLTLLGWFDITDLYELVVVVRDGISFILVGVEGDEMLLVDVFLSPITVMGSSVVFSFVIVLIDS